MIHFNDYKNKVTADQFNYIKQLAELEFYAKRLDYHLCERQDGLYEFIHELQLNDEVIVKDDIKDSYFDALMKKKLNHPPLTPIELQLKKVFIKHFVEIDEKIENKRHSSETVVSSDDQQVDYYSQTFFEKYSKLIYFLIIVIISVTYYFVNKVPMRKQVSYVHITSEESIAYILHRNDSIIGINNIFHLTGLGIQSFEAHTETGKVYHIRKTLMSHDTVSVILNQNMLTKNNTPIESTETSTSYIKINTNLSDFDGFIDKTKIAKENLNKWIEVNSGDHVFEVYKEGYNSLPLFRNFFLRPNDSISVSFKLSIKTEDVTVFNAKLRVTSNTKGADIYINGSNSGYKTNHTFQNLKEGVYEVDVRYNGYVNKTKTQTIIIKKGMNNYSNHFELIKSSGFLNIKTINTNGDIFLNGTKIGRGEITHKTESGSYTLSFSEVAGYHTPKLKKVNVTDGNIFHSAIYHPIINYSLTLNSNRIISKNFDTELGYSRFDFYKKDETKKPILESRNNASYLVFKHPFPYNNPSAGHALKMNFDLPQTFNYQQPLYLYLYMGYTDESYDITGAINPEISLYINNKNKLLNQKLTLTSIEAAKGNYIRFKVNELLRNGKNEIIIYVTDRNTVSINLYKLELR